MLLELSEADWNNGHDYTADELRTFLSDKGAWVHSGAEREIDFAEEWSYTKRLSAARQTRDEERWWCATVLRSAMEEDGFKSYGSRSPSAVSSRQNSTSSNQVLHPPSPHARAR